MSAHLPPADAAWHDGPDSYRHRTNDLWEAAALWARGWSHTSAEVDDGDVIFVYPDGGESLLEEVQRIRRGRCELNVAEFKSGYFQLRRLVNRTLADDARARRSA
jgi:hypothetical protein